MEKFAAAMKEPFFDKAKGLPDLDNIHAAYKEAERMVNNFCFDPKENIELFTEDKQLSGKIRPIAIMFIDYWAKANEVYIDGRNEHTVKLCRQIAEMEPFKILYNQYFEEGPYQGEDGVRPVDAALNFVNYTGHYMHRTLVQTFAGFLFCFIANDKAVACKKISQKMEEECGYKDWYKMPLI